MANVNTNAQRFLAGGILEIVDGGTTHTLLNLKPGSLRWKPATASPVTYTDRGVQQQPLRGDDVLGEVSVEVHAMAFETNSLYDVLMAEGTNGVVKEYTINIKIPTAGRGGSSGELIPFLTAHIDRTTVEWQEGTDTDTLRFTARFRTSGTTANPSITTY